MLKAGKTDELILIGLADENIDRLKNGNPILTDLSAFWPGREGKIAIIHGKTHTEIESMVRPLVSASCAPATDPQLATEEARAKEHEKILICTTGLPRSGKSTWAKKQCYPIVNPDSIRIALHGQRFAADAEPYVWAIAKTMVKSLFMAGHSKVILDATMNTRKRRDPWVCKDWKTYFKVIDTPKHICMERAKLENDEVIIPVIERMDTENEPLGTDEEQW